jgi:Putative DNA-binding domain
MCPMRRSKVDELLVSPSVLALGKFHWILLRSAEAMDKERFVQTETAGGFRSGSVFTGFGEEVALDEIHWWVFTKESSRNELRERTKVTLQAAQVLQRAAAKLRNNSPGSYEDLLLSLKEFANAHSSEIAALLGYVTWLKARDARAPRILFTYRVWGSTRMADRSVDVGDHENLSEDFQRLLAEVVLGIRDAFSRRIDEIRGELAYEMWDSVDSEYQSEIHVPESTLIVRTAHDVYFDCSVYFDEIRQSLRNILLDVNKFEDERDLTESDGFWRDFIVKAANWKGAERQIWDFKETLPMWHITHATARQGAKVEFGEDIAAFANTTGGVLVIGVTDKTRQIVGIIGSRTDLENRLKFISDVIATVVEHGARITKVRQVSVKVTDEDKIVVVVLVAQANGVIGVDNGAGQYSFPVRRETGKALVSKGEIAGTKRFIKSDNYDFLKSLATFVREG